MRTSVQILALFALLLLLSQCTTDEPRDTKRPGSKNTVDTSSSGSCGDAQYDNWETSRYVLPYPVGTQYSVNLSHCGGSYHSEGQPDQYAIDFVMPIGTEVTASRDGQVVFVEESGENGSFPNNVVIVQHSDGSYTQYMHLTKDGAEVTVGEFVSQGDPIGLSGNTGLAGYPHLHFVATKKGSFKYPYDSFPTTFKNTLANERSLLPQTVYPAQPY